MVALMSPRVTIDGATGSLVVGGKKFFPIGLSNPPPPGSKTPNGVDGLKEVRGNGVNFVRTGIQDWAIGGADSNISKQQGLHKSISDSGLFHWLWLGTVPNFRGTSVADSTSMLTKLVSSFRNDDSLLAYKGIDEPLHGKVDPGGMIDAFKKLKALDPDHPVVVIQAPTGTVANLKKYTPAFDITGIDIFPVAYPPGKHSDLGISDINVVGAVARRIREAAHPKPFWMTLQIAWSGVAARKNDRPNVVPRFPTLQQERFMAYQAIVNGARGLTFFGGHMLQVMKPDDAARGWNWTFWRTVLRPVVSELASDDVSPALVAPDVTPGVKVRSPNVKQMELVTRKAGRFLYVIAVRIAEGPSKIKFTGVPNRANGQPVKSGEVLNEWAQATLPPPITGNQALRRVTVTDGGFEDWFGPHDVHVYRFAL